MHKGLGRQRLAALFVAGALLLNFPLLALWDRDATVLGLPLFPAALFILWGGLIVVLGVILETIDDAAGAVRRPPGATPGTPLVDRGERAPRGGPAAD